MSYTDEDKIINIHLDYSQVYLTLKARSSGTFNFSGSSSGETINTVQYSTDNGKTWSEASSSVTVNVNSGDKVLWKGSNLTPFQNKGIGTFSASTANFDTEGNIMSLLFGDNFVGQTDLSEKNYAFYNLFKNTKCVNADNFILPATTLSNYCYDSLFFNCTSLITAPKLPATTLSERCYNYMFNECTSLTTAPELPATTLSKYCYNYMFNNCTSLAASPELPATTLSSSCYCGMFSGTNVLPDCSNIDFTSESVVASCGLISLFNGTKVTDNDLRNILPINPSTNKYWLPVKTLVSSCYAGMFRDCTSLITAPELPATTLKSNCYSSMFSNCTSLTQAPQLKATTLTDTCYQLMFDNCTSLTQPPTISATTLGVRSCAYMFQNCTSLTQAPILSAKNLINGCYNGMFKGCTKLNYIKAMFTNTPSKTYSQDWVYGVASKGTFVKNSTTTWTTRGTHAIPTGWTINTASS